ncbi:MAG: SPFH domain-containing protein [Bacillaceae bacterium]
MGLIKAVTSTIKGTLADQWLEVIEPQEMTDTTVMTKGVKVRRDNKRNQNKKGTDDTVSNGSVIHVYPNQCMILVDGGKIVDYTAEEGYYEVNDSTQPSLFSGELDDVVQDAFERFKFGGTTPRSQKVFYLNLKEIKGIKFGTPNPLNYFDQFYNAELFLRTFGTYSIKIVNPIKFFRESLSYDQSKIDIQDINEQYLSEFLSALQSAITQMSADGIRVSYVPSKSLELSKYMASILDHDWEQMRGIHIQSVGIANISYDEESKKLINMRSQGAMLGDATIREGYVQGTIAKGIEAAGSNSAGAMNGFMGINMGMQQAGNFMQSASQSNQMQMQQQQQQAINQQAATPANEWTCSCGTTNSGKFCTNCGTPKPVSNSWTCKCGAQNTGKFCSECGSKKPEQRVYVCDKCGYKPSADQPLPKFCPECGDPFNELDQQ